MGLLGRKHTSYQLPNARKTQDQSNDGPSQSSLIAAQAAAQLFQNNNNSQNPIPNPPPSASAEKRPGTGARRTSSVHITPTLRTKSVVLRRSPAPTHATHNHTNDADHDHNAIIENLSLSDHNIDVKHPSKLNRANSRSPAPLPVNHTESHSSQISTSNSMQAIANAAAKSAATSAANSTADLLAPPNHINKVYPSSPQISYGSSNSIDSAPFSLKPPPVNISKSTTEITEVQQSADYPQQYQLPPKFYFDADPHVSDYSFDNFDRSSIRSSSAGSEYISTPKQKPSGGSSSHLPLDSIPTRIDEHELEYEYESEPNDYEYNHIANIANIDDGDDDNDEDNEYDEYYSDVPDTPLDPLSKVSSTNTVNYFNRKPIRKPPPLDAPILPPSFARQESNGSIPPSKSQQPQLSRRNTSPRRKPPPVESYQYDTDSVLESEDQNTTYEEEEDDDPLPQYPLSVEDQEARRRHRHRHGFRKNAKNLFKKGFRSATSSNPSSYLVHDEDAKPVQFRSTMRKERKKSIFNEDKPWKHHNDREYITEQERKRYDGVWMANKGTYLNLIEQTRTNNPILVVESETDPALKASILSTGAEQPAQPESDLMISLVVKDLWERSHLPPDLLRQIWDLVDTRGDGCLERKSFIIGMWLVDQCLYGRKLPKQLDASVWNSLSQLGVNVVIKPKKRSR